MCHNHIEMKSKKYSVHLFAVLLALLITSIALNFYLFGFSKQYYLQLNGTRLDPLGLDSFSSEMRQQGESDTGAIFVVFFGDSRAAEWPAPSLDGFEFANRGIGAQTSSQVMQRYDAHITPLNPDVLVVQVCINDIKTIPLFPERKSAIIATCKENIEQIVKKAHDHGVLVMLSTVFPTDKFPLERRIFWSEDIPVAIDEVNSFIKSLESEQVIIFDAFAVLADEDGQLAEEYGRDELHLNPAGYRAVNQAFEKLLRSFAD